MGTSCQCLINLNYCGGRPSEKVTVAVNFCFMWWNELKLGLPLSLARISENRRGVSEAHHTKRYIVKEGAE